MAAGAHRFLQPVAALLFALACAGPAWRMATPPPAGRLPGDVRPTHYELAFEIDPDRERFSGTARIDVVLAAPVEVIRLHGRDLGVRSARVRLEGGEARSARWEAGGAAGGAALVLPEAIGPGRAEIHIAWDAAFGTRGRGLYRVVAGGEAYAFTHFEPIAARLAFPGFDEPGFKTPFDLSLVVRSDHTAVSNTPIVAEEPAGEGFRRVRFATTPPLPTYLVAWGVGPLDVVSAPAIPPNPVRADPLPLRGVAPRGRGAELASALRETPRLLAPLERYFGTAYPYPKLDLVAVPQFAPGAMENAGAVFFREELLMLDGPTADESLRRGFAYVMAHELAHQWFGNLVTLAWWNDIWLNEAFATWLGRRVEGEVFPGNEAGASLLAAVQRAMSQDALVNARSIRRPVDDDHDIYAAFDAITYDKGGGVLAMFERWLSPEVFRSGIRLYLARHRMGNATADDLLAALTEAADRDVAAAFSTFLTQPGVPLLEAASVCDEAGGGLRVRQSRYLPLGSAGSRDATWQIPLCVRYGVGDAVHESCTLLRERETRIPLAAGCPTWLMPNADAAGYYHFVLAPGDARALRERGRARLSPRERLALADSTEAAFRAGVATPEEVYGALAAVAADGDRRVAEAPMSLLELARRKLVPSGERPAVERFAAALYAPRLDRLGWDAAPGESGEARLLRRSLVDFLASQARDPAVRREAARRGRRYAGLDGAPRDRAALEPELAETALSVVIEEGGDAEFDALEALFRASDDPLERSALLHALGSARDPERSRRARRLALDPALQPREVWSPLYRQSREEVTRADAWSFVEANFDALVERAGPTHSGWMPWLAAGFCDEGRADAVEAFLRPRIDAVDGGPRQLAGSLEAIRLCAALEAAQGPATTRFFAEVDAALLEPHPPGDDQLHDLVGSGVDALDRGVGVVPRDRVLRHEAVAPVQL